ncbi:DNA primase small subunit [Ceratobasidium sp. AG-Ba]|nr:DNA primase small subunit [Ceratobasidium sp. AG-Ba]
MASLEVDASSPEVTLAFYRRLYPFKPIFNWLNQEHAPSRLTTNREFALTLQGDVYLRYNSFGNAEDMKKEICRYNPTRFEIGAIYSARPRDKKSLRPGAFTPTARELVFDLDMTDYDSIRTCCTGKGICRKCWKFIAAAVEVLDTTLREDFGYRHLLGGKEQIKKVNVRLPGTGSFGPGPLHPALERALKILSARFASLILDEQDVFLKSEGWRELLELIPNKDVAGKLYSQWEGEDQEMQTSSDAKWDALRKAILTFEKGTTERATLKAAVEDVILQYTYPRIDTEVSKHRNHLLKAPFCVHPGTGKVCVPVDPARVDDFDPETVPSVGQLLQELNNVPDSGTGSEHHSDWEHTSLKPYVEMLEKHAAAIINDTRERKRGIAKTSLDF